MRGEVWEVINCFMQSPCPTCGNTYAKKILGKEFHCHHGGRMFRVYVRATETWGDEQTMPEPKCERCDGPVPRLKRWCDDCNDTRPCPMCGRHD